MHVPDRTDLIRRAFSRDELILINNALNEVCNGIDFSDGEFAARLGAVRQEVLEILRRVAEALSDDPA